MTPNKEDYLKCIFELAQTGEKITNKQIAEYMNFSAPAVSEMMKKMLAENLIVKVAKTGYALSQEGLEMVSQLYRKHRLIEVFLVQKLAYSPDKVHEEAEILEHTVSDYFINRLEELLDFPEACPHGSTIPKEGQILVERYSKTLATIKEKGNYQLVRVRDYFQLLQYLEQHDLAVGDDLHVLDVDSFAQTITLESKGKERTIPLSIAKHLYIEKAES